jgi:hypothetical protein
LKATIHGAISICLLRVRAKITEAPNNTLKTTDMSHPCIITNSEKVAEKVTCVCLSNKQIRKKKLQMNVTLDRNKSQRIKYFRVK